MAQPIRLEGKDILEVINIDKNKPYKAGTKKEGEFYSRYRYEGIVFTVDEKNPFVADFAKGNIKSIKLLDDTRQVSVDDKGVVTSTRKIDLDSYLSREQHKGFQEDRMLEAQVEAKIKRYETIATMPITSDMLAELEAIA
jgi:hypothetical protein